MGSQKVGDDLANKWQQQHLIYKFLLSWYFVPSTGHKCWRYSSEQKKRRFLPWCNVHFSGKTGSEPLCCDFLFIENMVKVLLSKIIRWPHISYNVLQSWRLNGEVWAFYQPLSCGMPISIFMMHFTAVCDTHALGWWCQGQCITKA